MSKLFRHFFCCFLVSALLGPACTLRAQEEPIAVAAPVAKEIDNDVVKPEAVLSDAVKVDAAKLDAIKVGEGRSSSDNLASPDSRVRPLTVSIQLLRTDLVLTGALTDSTMLALRTAFGEASIPLSEVAGVRFPSGQDTSTTLVMLNGDSITGASDVKTVTVETEWGSAKVNGENISSMMFVPGLEWQSAKGLNGNRWTLTEAKAKPAGTSPAPLGNSPNNSIPGLPQPNSALSPASAGAQSNNNTTPRVVFPR